MAKYLKPLFIISAAALAAGPAMSQAPQLDAVSAQLLAAHNAERARIGVPPLQWDAALASAALSYGPALSRLGALQHSPKETRPGQRENLWKGTSHAYLPQQMVDTWIAERRFFRPGVFPAVSTTGNWLDVAHYTTMIWPTTTRLGCAVYRAPGWDYLICRYSPPGNVDGKPLLLPQQGDRG